MHHVKNARACMQIIIVDCESGILTYLTLDFAVGKDRRYFRRTTLELEYLMPERNLKFLMSAALLDTLRALSKTQSFGLLP